MMLFSITHKWDCVKSAIDLLSYSFFPVLVFCSFDLKGAGD